MQGHIIFISASTELVARLSRLTAHWLMEHQLDSDPVIYVCHDLELAERSIQYPLSQAQPPALVVLDHAVPDRAMARFSEKLKNCVPETWVVDILSKEGVLPTDLDHSYVVPKPFQDVDWEAMLAHLFLHAATPQWSRALLADGQD